MELKQVWNDSSLIGHSLLQISESAWNFTTGDLSDHGQKEIDSRHPKQYLGGFYRSAVHKKENTYIFTSRFVGQETLIHVIELIARRIGGFILTVASTPC